MNLPAQVDRAQLAVFSAAVFLVTAFAHAAAPRALPAWYQAELTRLTAGDGRWVASNAEYTSADEVFDAYAITWARSADGRGMTGRLTGLKANKELTEFWQFRVWWDAESQEAMVAQFSSFGIVGQGRMVGFGAATLSDQRFTGPDGAHWRELHHSWFEGDTHVTQSMDWSEGAWVAKRRYRWQQAKPK